MKQPNKKKVYQQRDPLAYLRGWFTPYTKGGSAEARELASKWIKENTK